MKRFLFITVGLLFCVLPQVKAQQGFISSSMTTTTINEETTVETVEPENVGLEKPTSTTYVGFQQSANIQVGPDSECYTNVMGNYVAGWRFNNLLFVGGGIGLGYAYGFAASLYANTRLYITKTRAQPFYDLSLGGAITEEGIDATINSQIGVNFRTSHKKLSPYVSAGVQYFPVVGYYAIICKLGLNF